MKNLQNLLQIADQAENVSDRISRFSLAILVPNGEAASLRRPSLIWSCVLEDFVENAERLQVLHEHINESCAPTWSV